MIATIIMVLIAAYLALYFYGRYYLRENYASGPPPVYDTTGVRLDLTPDRPFVSDPINSLDDYEYSLVFQNEGNRTAGRAAINAAMSRYPLDWVNRPPSDEKFQSYRDAFIDASQKAMAPNTEGFNTIQGATMIPPDQDALDAEELRILQTYEPEKPQDLVTYSVDDATNLVRKIYERRGEEAVVEKSKQGTNVFEIVEVKKKNEPVQWVDDLPAVERSGLRGENQIVVPTVATDIAAGLDPFYEPRTTVRMNRNDYTQWTPGLERQFAPTYPVKNWY